MSSAVAARPPLRIALGGDAVSFVPVDLPVLAGTGIERLFGEAAPTDRSGRFDVFESPEWRIGAASLSTAGGLETATRQLYEELFALAGSRTLARIWNYVPAINAAGAGGLENYRAFCRGRSEVFESAFGSGFKHRVPAASAVGSEGDTLVVVFAATHQAVRHVENPRQLPAYDYPSDYGPRPPSFARASVVLGAAGQTVFISGTSAVHGHATVAPGRTATQLDCTLINLHAISQACGLGSELAAGRASRQFKVYLRHASDLTAVDAQLRARLIGPHDAVTYLRSDICRSDLNIEIEALIAPDPPAG